jgi:enoyl-CoA hydratase
VTDSVLTEVRGPLLLVTLNRPHAKNAIDTDLAQGLLHAIELLDGDPALAVGVITGAGGAFSSGLDLKAFASVGPPKGLTRFLRSGSQKPLIAAIEGVALAGGLEVALTCDLLVAAREATFGVPEVRVGLLAAGGALYRLPQRMPWGVALELALTGASIDASEAARLGLVNQVVEVGEALDAAVELAARIAGNAPLSLRTTKRLMREAAGLSEAEFWDTQRPHMDAVFRTNDAREGAIAFAEKRSPEWTGT